MSEDDLKKPFSRLDAGESGPASRGRRWPMALRDLDPTSSARRRVLDKLTDEDDEPHYGNSRVSSLLPNPVGPAAPRGASASRSSLPRVMGTDQLSESGRPALSTSSFSRDSADERKRSDLDQAPRSSGDIVPLRDAHYASDILASKRRPVTAPPPVDRVLPALSLSPRMTAIFGALFGLATITTIIALLIQAAPPKDDRAAIARAASAAQASASASSGSGAGAPRASKKRVRTLIPGPWRISALEKDPSVKIVTDAIDRRSFVAALDEKGITKDQVYRLLKAFDGVHSFDKTNKNDTFIAAIDRTTKQIKAFEYVVSPEEIYQAKEGANGALAAAPLDLKIGNEEVSGSIYIGKNLGRSIEDAGFEPNLTKALDEAFLGRISSEGFEEGGTLRVVAVETTALGAFVRYKQVIAAEYHPPDPTAPPIRAYLFDGAHFHGYVDEQGKSPDGTGWTKPVPTAPITSHFNPKRMHPILHKIVPHTGTDFGAPSGTPIYAAFRGKVTLAGNAGPCGNMVQIDHPGGIQSGYCHMSKFAPGIKEGSMVGTKQLIGFVGTTGRSTGPHLHFWVKRNGVFFDAETLKLNSLKPLPPEEKDGFTAKKTELDARLDAIAMPDPPPPEPVATAPSASPSSSSNPSSDTTPNIGRTDDPSDDPPDEKPGPKKPGNKPHAPPANNPSTDTGDDEDLIGADLKNTPTKK